MKNNNQIKTTTAAALFFVLSGRPVALNVQELTLKSQFYWLIH